MSRSRRLVGGASCQPFGSLEAPVLLQGERCLRYQGGWGGVLGGGRWQRMGIQPCLGNVCVRLQVVDVDLGSTAPTIRNLASLPMPDEVSVGVGVGVVGRGATGRPTSVEKSFIVRKTLTLTLPCWTLTLPCWRTSMLIAEPLPASPLPCLRRFGPRFSWTCSTGAASLSR
jgi:hypothetical protein